MKAILMKAILTTMTVLGLCVSLSGLRVPGSGAAGNPRANGYGQGHPDRSGRDCSSDDNHGDRGGDRD
jgi:hypothetical protein